MPAHNYARPAKSPCHPAHAQPHGGPHSAACRRRSRPRRPASPPGNTTVCCRATGGRLPLRRGTWCGLEASSAAEDGTGETGGCMDTGQDRLARREEDNQGRAAPQSTSTVSWKRAASSRPPHRLGHAGVLAGVHHAGRHEARLVSGATQAGAGVPGTRACDTDELGARRQACGGAPAAQGWVLRRRRQLGCRLQPRRAQLQVLQLLLLFQFPMSNAVARVQC